MVHEALSNHNTAFGQQEEMLQSLMSSNTALYKQLSTMTERVMQLASRSSAPAPVVMLAPVVNPVMPDKVYLIVGILGHVRPF